MTTIEQVIQSAQAQGLLPADAVPPQVESRPWPVVLLTAIGAWFAAIPLMFMVAMLFGDLLKTGAGTYIVGALVLGAAIVILRSRDVALFVEQLAVPALLVGGGSLAMGLFRDMAPQGAALMLALIACAIAWIVPRAWLRVLLGALACGLLVLAAMPLSYTDWHGSWRLPCGWYSNGHWRPSSMMARWPTALPHSRPLRLVGYWRSCLALPSGPG